MKKRLNKDDKWLQKQCDKYGIDPDWYDSKRELYRVLAYYKEGDKGKKWRKRARRTQNTRIRQEPLEDKNGETNIPKYQPDRWMWD